MSEHKCCLYHYKLIGSIIAIFISVLSANGEEKQLILDEAKLDSVLANFIIQIDDSYQLMDDKWLPALWGCYDKDLFEYLWGYYDKEFLENIVVAEIDTTMKDSIHEITHPRPIEFSPLRVAVDKDYKVYKLFGFDGNQFNDLAVKIISNVSVKRARRLGEIFIRLTQLYDETGKHYFIYNLDEFIEENHNRSMVLDDDITLRRHENWESVERRIYDIFSKIDLDKICYDYKDECYLFNYYIWRESTGDLIHYDLSITNSGNCTLNSVDIIAEDFGYWREYRM
jgi:hypothetical protein